MDFSALKQQLEVKIHSALGSKVVTNSGHGMVFNVGEGLTPEQTQKAYATVATPPGAKPDPLASVKERFNAVKESIYQRSFEPLRQSFRAQGQELAGQYLAKPGDSP